jgi:hypothetical protein
MPAVVRAIARPAPPARPPLTPSRPALSPAGASTPSALPIQASAPAARPTAPVQRTHRLVAPAPAATLKPAAPVKPVASKPAAMIPSHGAALSAAPAKVTADEAKILFQNFFKSVGPRTYAAQLKEAGNGNHFLVLTEGKRDKKTAEVRKTRLFVFSEDFPAFFKLIHETAAFVQAHPVSEEVRQRQAEFWRNSQKRGRRKPGRQAR